MKELLLRTGMIGCGHFAHRHANILTAMEDVQLVGFCDKNVGSAVESEKDLYLAETCDLLAAIREDRPTVVPIEEGVRSLRLALAAAQSAEQGAPVEITLCS